MCGARPVFVDIDPLTLNMATNAFRTAITPRTRAVLPVHLFGQPADLEGLAAVCRSSGLRLLADAGIASGVYYPIPLHRQELIILSDSD